VTEDLDPTDDSPAQTNAAGVSVLLLAAGSSSRMGKSKQLLDIAGIPLLRHSAKVAHVAESSQTIVVLGANEMAHREILEGIPVEIVTNHFWKSGMGSSIKTGLQYIIQKYPETQAILIMVCDQPTLQPAHIQALINAYSASDKKIVASAYDGTVGVPAIFGRSFFSNLLMLQDDEGAKKIIEQFPEQTVAIDLPEGAIDLDTVEDYENYISQNKKVTG
jgi:molybdenum cofactor cytidylyltransferase